VVLSFNAQPFHRKETCLVEGRLPCNALLAQALTLDVFLWKGWALNDTLDGTPSGST